MTEQERLHCNAIDIGGLNSSDRARIEQIGFDAWLDEVSDQKTAGTQITRQHRHRKKCAICEAFFLATRADAQYCSHKCQLRGNRRGLAFRGPTENICASLFLLAYGLDAVWSDGHFVSSARLGWVELFLAAVLIPLTMHLWIQFFAGCVAFGFLKSVLVAIAGRDWFPPHLPFSRLEAAEMAFFFGATLIWLIRFAKARPALADRIAIAVYMFSFLGYRNNPHFSIVQGVVGLAALFLEWGVSRWRGRGRKAPNHPLVHSSNFPSAYR
jgi:hypothetical protein